MVGGRTTKSMYSARLASRTSAVTLALGALTAVVLLLNRLRKFFITALMKRGLKCVDVDFCLTAIVEESKGGLGGSKS